MVDRGMDLVCEFEEHNWYQESVYWCIVQLPDITEPSTQIKAIHGKHQDGKSNADIKGLNFNSIVNFIPKGLDVFFPNVTKLQINCCGLKSICRKDLSQFPKLERLSIFINELTTFINEQPEVDFFLQQQHRVHEFKFVQANRQQV
jgi:hypothetical protein